MRYPSRSADRLGSQDVALETELGLSKDDP